MNEVNITINNNEVKEYYEKICNLSNLSFEVLFKCDFEKFCGMIRNANYLRLKNKNKNLSGIFIVSPNRIKTSSGITYGLIGKEKKYEE